MTADGATDAEMSPSVVHADEHAGAMYIAIFFEIVQPAATSADSLTQGSGAGEGVITS